MAIRKFINAAFSGYYFDTELDCVMSIKRPGAPYALTWTTPNNYLLRRVSMTTTSGGKISRTYNQIIDMLCPVEHSGVVRSVPAPTPNDELSNIQPDFDYVLYSVKNKCSQYFFKGTSIRKALDLLAQRKQHVSPEDIRICNTVTGQVTKLQIRTVQIFSLA